MSAASDTSSSSSFVSEESTSSNEKMKESSQEKIDSKYKDGIFINLKKWIYIGKNNIFAQYENELNIIKSNVIHKYDLTSIDDNFEKQASKNLKDLFKILKAV